MVFLPKAGTHGCKFKVWTGAQSFATATNFANLMEPWENDRCESGVLVNILEQIPVIKAMITR